MLKYQRFLKVPRPDIFSKIDVGEIVGKENVSLTKDQWSEIPINIWEESKFMFIFYRSR